jgi:hypothetical protein
MAGEAFRVFGFVSFKAFHGIGMWPCCPIVVLFTFVGLVVARFTFCGPDVFKILSDCSRANK